MSKRTKEVTHKIMSAIKQRDTKPEVMLRKALWAEGLRFRKNFKKLTGKPDVVFTRARIAIFCDGDFWHGHNWAIRGLQSLEEETKNYSQFWRDKIHNNVDRDRIVTEELEAQGWFVLRFWESEIEKDIDACVNRIINEYIKRTIVFDVDSKM